MIKKEVAAVYSGPLREMPEEAKSVMDRGTAEEVRLIGGLAMRMCCTSLSFCQRP